jgi:hypothetical protein
MLPLLVALVLAAAVGAVIAIRADAAGKAPARSAASAPLLPISPAMARRLPAGTFYFLAGTNNISSNIWKVSGTGTVAQLTHNGHNFGISNFGASTAGISMGDGAGGGDVLAALTAKGPIELRDGGDGDGPAINAAGQVCYAKTIDDQNGNPAYQELMVRASLNGPARVRYKIKVSDNVAGLLENAWGPNGSIVALVGGHYPGEPGPESELITVSKTGKVTRVRTGVDARLGSVVWSEQGGGIAIGVTAGRGKVIYSATRQYSQLEAPTRLVVPSQTTVGLGHRGDGQERVRRAGHVASQTGETVDATEVRPTPSFLVSTVPDAYTGGLAETWAPGKTPSRVGH